MIQKNYIWADLNEAVSDCMTLIRQDISEYPRVKKRDFALIDRSRTPDESEGHLLLVHETAPLIKVLLHGVLVKVEYILSQTDEMLTSEEIISIITPCSEIISLSRNLDESITTALAGDVTAYTSVWTQPLWVFVSKTHSIIKPNI